MNRYEERADREERIRREQARLDEAGRRRSKANGKGDGSWEGERSEGLPPLPSAEPWPVDMSEAAYHGLTGEMVRAIEPHTESDPAALLVQFMTGFGVLVGHHPYYEVEGSRHYLNLFVLLVGGTSKGRKGTSWDRVKSLFSRVQEWPRTVTGLSSGEGLKWQVRDPPPIKPKKKKFKKDFEDEQEEDPGVTDKRLLVVEPEFAAVTRAVQRQGSTLSSTIRSAWDTGDLATLTKHDSITATGAHIAIIGHVTTDELRAELTKMDMANGFANRFLFVCSKRSKLLPDGGEDLPEASVADLGRRIARCAGLARDVKRMTKTAAARDMWHAIYPSLSEGKAGLYGAVTARAEAQVCRLAALYALLDEATSIDVWHLQAALAVLEYCDASARHVFGTLTGLPRADRMLQALRTAGDEGMTRTQISALLGRNLDATAIDVLLALLEARGLISASIARGTGGHSRAVWRAAG